MEVLFTCMPTGKTCGECACMFYRVFGVQTINCQFRRSGHQMIARSEGGACDLSFVKLVNMYSKREFNINVLHDVAAHWILWYSRNDEGDKKSTLWHEMQSKQLWGFSHLKMNLLKLSSQSTSTKTVQQCLRKPTFKSNTYSISNCRRCGFFF